MPKLPTDEEKARMALAVFGHFKSRPGDVLADQNFYTYAALNSLSFQELMEGLAIAYDLDWVEDHEKRAHKLTSLGYEEI